MNKKPQYFYSKGAMLVQVLVFAAVASVLLVGLIGWAASNVMLARESFYREQAFQIAEAGIEYYRWHLAHADTDYQDGTGVAGPYVHDYYDKNGTLIGTFTLDIIPPPNGSTKVTVRSKGIANASPAIYRRIEAQFAKPSFAKYQMVTDSNVFYGSGDEVWGPLHSNKGIGFWNGSPQPKAHNLVTSAVATFNYGGSNHFGIYTTVPGADPTPPATVPSRPDVFMGGRQFPVQTVDFSGITADLSAIRTEAQNNGFWEATIGGGKPGYHVVLKTDHTFDLYIVNSLVAAPGGCNDAANEGAGIWGTHSIKAGAGTQTLQGNFPIPADGILFFDDNVWVDGTINGDRITIGAGIFPVPGALAQMKNIIVNDNLLYTDKANGNDVIALIAQGYFFVGLKSADNLEIDAAIVAQNGGTIRNYYSNNCGIGYLRTTLTTYGMLASKGQGYFYWGSSGYQNQPANYDPNLKYSPPPSFPITADGYDTVYWQEIK